MVAAFVLLPLSAYVGPLASRGPSPDAARALPLMQEGPCTVKVRATAGGKNRDAASRAPQSASALPRALPQVVPVGAADYFLATPLLRFVSVTLLGVLPPDRAFRGASI